MDKLSEDEIATRLTQLAGWTRQGDLIARTYTLPGFPEAIGFVTQVAFLAENLGHHPDIDIRYNKVTLGLTTHDAGGLTALDFGLAEHAETLARHARAED